MIYWPNVEMANKSEQIYNPNVTRLLGFQIDPRSR